MRKKEPVSHIMSTHLHTAKENDTLFEAAAIIRKFKIRHLPVVKGKEIKGIISSSDINRLTFGRLFEGEDDADEAVFEMLSLEQVMTKNIRTVTSETTIKDVAEIFAKEDFHSLPVVDSGVLKGIVTTTDVIRYMLEQY